MSKIKVPDGMLKAADKAWATFGGREEDYRIRECLKSALQWLGL